MDTPPPTHATSTLVELTDYRARVAQSYADVRRDGVSNTTREAWRAAREQLFATHPQSPLAGQAAGRLRSRFWAYDASWSFHVAVESDDIDDIVLPTATGEHRFRGVGTIGFTREGVDITMPIYWADSYGGGWFLPFGDPTNGTDTFGSGRYVLDGAKGADLGVRKHQLVVDFNFAYHPSCVWGDWVCPLPTRASRLDVPVRAGERTPSD